MIPIEVIWSLVNGHVTTCNVIFKWILWRSYVVRHSQNFVRNIGNHSVRLSRNLKRCIEKYRLLMKCWIHLTDTRVDGDGENDMEDDPDRDLSDTDLLPGHSSKCKKRMPI
jgi:hypothetical protein